MLKNTRLQETVDQTSIRPSGSEQRGHQGRGQEKLSGRTRSKSAPAVLSAKGSQQGRSKGTSELTPSTGPGKSVPSRGSAQQLKLKAEPSIKADSPREGQSLSRQKMNKYAKHSSRHSSSSGKGQSKLGSTSSTTTFAPRSASNGPGERDWLKSVLPSPQKLNNLTDEEKRQRISACFVEIMETLGLDLNDDSLADTPRRIVKMYVDEIFAGLNPVNAPKITRIDNSMSYDQMVVVRDINVLSTCEHHFQTIHGTAVVAYIPNKKVIGLSKINRIVDFFARRPQVQERLTKQIADALQTILDTPHIAVSIQAKHYCVIARGIRDTNSQTSTSDLRGDFRSDLATREEFLAAATFSPR